MTENIQTIGIVKPSNIDSTHLDNSDDNLELLVRREQVEPIYGQNINAFVGQLLSAVVAAALIWTTVSSEKILIWLGVFTITQCACYFYAGQFKALPRPLSREQITFWLKVQLVLTSVTASAWSIGALYLWSDSILHQFFFLFVIMVTVAGSMIVLSSFKMAYMTYAFVAVVPVALRFLVMGTQDQIAIGLAALIGTAMLLRVAERNNQASIRALWVGVKYRQQAQALQESEARFRALSQAAFEGIAIHEKGQILDANDAVLEMIGYDEAEITKLTMQDLMTDKSYELASEYTEEDYELPYELRAVHKDGTTFPVEVQGKSIPFDDGEARVVAIRDITMRKELERKALALQLEQARTQLLTTFFQNASHEFRTPLSIISTANYILRRSSTSEKQQENVAKIDEQVKRINRLVETLLFMVRLNTDSEMDVHPTDVHALLQSIVDMTKVNFDSKQHLFQLEFATQLPTIQANEKLLSQALSEIFKNAATYTADGGTITVRTDCDDERLHIEIHDTGIGMSEDEASRIFERFYRVDEAHSTAGFGVGLAIAKTIIERHGGTISVQSEVDEGSRFRIELPYGDV